MASFVALTPSAKDEYFSRIQTVRKEYPVKNKAAITIQRFVRGFLTRQHFLKLNRNAMLYQKYVKGHLARRKILKLPYSIYFNMLMKKYNHCATLIQSLWRGYCDRKNIMDFYKLKEWHKFVQEENENLLNEIARRRENPPIDPEYSAVEVNLLKDWIKYISFKTHHLIRTKAIPGVYSVKGNPNHLSLIELFMSSLNVKPFIDGLRDERLRFVLKLNNFKKEEIWLKYIKTVTQTEKVILQQFCLDNSDIF